MMRSELGMRVAGKQRGKGRQLTQVHTRHYLQAHQNFKERFEAEKKRKIKRREGLGKS